MIKQKILAVLTSLCIGVLPLAAGMAAAPVAAEDTTEPVRILAMGDSITDGYINGDNGYRKYFCYEMQQKGFTNFDMVGPKNNWSDSVSYTTSDGVTFQYDPAHAGYSGYAIEKIGSRQGLYETIFDTTYYNNNVTGNMIEAYDPDIVLLQIGTNDLLDNQNAGITDRLEKLVDKLLDSIDSDSMLFVASVPDIDVSVKHDWLWAYQSSGYSYENNPEEFTALVEQSVDNYNASVKELVEKKQAVGARIRFADINSVVDMKTGLEDGVHPNEAGYACRGKYWSE
uniref:GDSL-type esterase/lipase family protein n=1 Tax=Ruminococcus callidus TaxID=40519 RepID=UPI0023F91725